uniref:Cyclin D3-3 n=1 Tax=Dimocarpus longan TaxID=128017 RepID=A0A8G0QY18_9ROSI|nr:cyclin D3-3 [Dimocarpus longan]
MIMAIVHEREQQNPSSSFLLDALYCEEERWEDEEEEGGEGFGEVIQGEDPKKTCLSPFLLLEQDLFWEDEELLSLFSKEKEQQAHFNLMSSHYFDKASSCGGGLALARGEAVEWVLKVVAHYGFTTLTAVLAINYLDRLLFSLHFQSDKPWMIQLLAVTCLSLAAKVEETQVPLLLDLQVEDTKYVFEAKDIQRMELLVLSTLKWKMHLVTPLSFLDHIIRRLGLKTNVHWEFLRRCERLLLTLVSDSRFVSYLPSVLATATMMHVINEVEPLHSIDYQNQLLGVINISKEKVNECYKHVVELSSTCAKTNRKRKLDVIDRDFSSCDSSSSSSSSSSQQSPEPVLKKSRPQPQPQDQKPLPLRVSVGSPS